MKKKTEPEELPFVSYDDMMEEEKKRKEKLNKEIKRKLTEEE